uniref:Uncharacterized protein n=1 Tax=Oryza barthii TaxID=65489 RepID=A0A0D3H5J3_9ORYZ
MVGDGGRGASWQGGVRWLLDGVDAAHAFGVDVRLWAMEREHARAVDSEQRRKSERRPGRRRSDRRSLGFSWARVSGGWDGRRRGGPGCRHPQRKA